MFFNVCIGIDFDPHFLATTATGHKLCYTVDGRDGEVYNILIDRGIVVNGKIICELQSMSHGTHLGPIHQFGVYVHV